MKWIGQHIYDLISRFRSDVYLEDISTGTIASGAHLGLDSNNKIVKAADGGGDLTGIEAGTGLNGDDLNGPIPRLNVDASQPGITTLAGVSAIGTAGTPIVITSDAVTFQSVNADDPIVTIKNTSNAANDMASLKFVKDRGAAPAVNDNLAEIYFIGEDSGQNSQEYGRILCETDVVTDGQESGRLKLGVANHDGGNGYGLTMQGGSVNDEVDVTIGLGANSVVTVPGDIDLEGDIDVNGTLETDALTIGGATIAAIGTTAITTLGTIGTGAWEGTAIASDQQKHLMHYQTVGYCSNSGSEYEMTRPMSVNQAPFHHDIPIGTDGLTAQTVQVWARAVGHVMPNNCTIKRWRGWTVSPGSTTSYVALFKVTLEDDVDSDPSAVLLTEVSYTPSGNATANSFNTTSASSGGTLEVSAGDIIFTAMKGPGNPMYFNATLEVEF